MSYSEKILSLDWGTTRGRLRLVNQESGAILHQYEELPGCRQLHRHGVESGVGVKTSYLGALMEVIHGGPAISAQIPLVISGMASSSIGIQEVPYSALPMTLDGRSWQMAQIDHDLPIGLCFLISGIQARRDVLRGEETQLVGLNLSGAIPEDCYVILPGTHSKHLRCERGRLVDFSTFMTGEIFELMSQYSILATSVKAEPAQDFHMSAFAQGVKQAASGHLLKELFQIRAGSLLEDDHHPGAAYYRLSGLLIGAELTDINPSALPLMLGSEGHLAPLYERALHQLDKDFNSISIDTMEKAVVVGQLAFIKNVKAG